MRPMMATGGKPHAVCIPLPFQGHIHATLKLARLLHSKGFHVTFVHTEANYGRILVSADTSTIDGFRYETIPDGLLPSDANQDPTDALLNAVKDKFAAPFRDLLNKLNDASSGVPPVTCIVSDSFTSFTLGIAEEFGIPCVLFCSVSAVAYLGFMHFEEITRRGLWPPKGDAESNNGHLDTCVDWIPGLKTIPMKQFIGFPHITDGNYVKFNFVKDEAQQARRASAIILNTFVDLEGEAIDAMASFLPPIYTVGPLTMLCRQTLDQHERILGGSNNLWKEDDSCLRWLDGKAPRSVLYLNIGSLAVMTSEQQAELAWGLANSGYDFLWVTRLDSVLGDSTVSSSEFVKETKGRGFITSWCPQEEVLMHPAVGGFLTHCGWNSMMEAVSAGVPLLCWPYFADQPVNCSYACEEWGIGMEIGGSASREGVERIIRELMGGEKGKEMRRRVEGLKENAVRATSAGEGKSAADLERVIGEVMLRKK